MRLRYQLVVAVLVITLMVTSFLAGRQFQSLAGSAPARGARADGLVSSLLGLGTASGEASGLQDVDIRPLETFQEVLSHLRRQYVSPIEDESALTYGAIRGMLGVLREQPYNDRYTRFLTPDEYRSFLEENEGHFGGIGAEIGVREPPVSAKVKADLPEGLRCPVCGAEIKDPVYYQVVIISPLPDSPAEKAGLKAGDHIIKVDDTLTARVGLSETVRLIKGRPGTAVKLLIGREGEPTPLEVTVTRAVIDVRSVDYKMLPGRVGYLRISTFNETTADLTKKALEALRKGGMRGLLLDLRNNAGGGLEVCIQVAGLFVGNGPVVYIEERGQPRQARSAVEDTHRFELPLVVLINQGSASAAEILAGAIQDAGVGTLVGATTFGKALVQTVIPLRDGSALALTTARYLTPKLRDIEQQGIKPDIAVEQTVSREYIPPLSDKDKQGAQALEILRRKMREPERAAA